MPMLRVRFTVRRLMIAVAVVAILIGVGLEGGRLYQRFHKYSRLASKHGFYEECLLGFANASGMMAEEYRLSAMRRSEGESDNTADLQIEWLTDERRFRRLAEYQAGIKAKFEAAKWRPWLDVEPDPPRPEL
jgi:hypothetical protein